MPVRRPFILAAAAALLAMAAGSAFPAQEAGLTLDQAIEAALARNPEVLAARARVEAAKGRTMQLKSRPEPQASASLEGLPLPGLRKDGDQAEIHLGIEQTFEYPGKRALRNRIGLIGEDAASAELERTRLLLAARVKRAYWNAAFARGAADALERSSARLEAVLEDLQARYRTGQAAYADVLRVRAEKARLRNAILDQAKEGRRAELELDELLGRDPGRPADLTTSLAFAPLEGDPASLFERAKASRPSFRLAALRNDQAAASVKAADLSRRPDFTAGLFVPSIRPNGWGVSLGLSLPFLRPGRAQGQAREAAAEAEAGRLAAEALDRHVRAAIETGFAAAKAAEAQVLTYEKSLLRELEDELGIELEYFRYGKAEAFAVLDLHRTYILAQVEHLRALLLYNIALADLEVAGESTD